jgi:hypothetical protein
VIQDFRLAVTAIYSNAAKRLARKAQLGPLMELFRHIKGTVPDADWDDVLLQVRSGTLAYHAA